MISVILKKYSKGHERSQKAKRNIIAALGIKGGSILINLMLVPLTIRYLNASEYGIWLTLSSIILWFSFFDIGLGHGLRNKLAEALARNDDFLAKTYISTTYALLSIVVCIVWLAFFCINFFLDWGGILNAGEGMKEELSKVVIIVFSAFCLQFVLRLIGTIFTANQQPAKSSLFDFFSALLSLGLIFLLSRVEEEGSLITLAIITGASQVAVLLMATIFFFRGKMSLYKPSIRFIDFSYARSLMGVGTKFFLIQVSSIFVFQSTNIIITQLMGPGMVTTYNIAYRYFAIATMITGIITAPFWSAFTEAYIKGDFKWIQNIIRKLDFFFGFIVLAVIIMIPLSQYAYKIWIGNKVSVPWSVSIIMAINIICTIRWNLYVSLINGTGKIRLQLLLNVFMSLFFIPLAILLGNEYALPGIVAANVLINLIYAIFIPIQSYKILNRTATGIWDKN